MKKFLLKAAIALLFGGILISCTHDTDASGSSTVNSEDLLKTYEQAFLNTFDRPVNGINWGFGVTNPVATSRSAVLGRENSYSSIYHFPSKPDGPAASAYIESVPEGITYLGTHTDVYGGYDTYWAELPNKTCWVDAAALDNKWKLHFDRYEGYVFYLVGDISVSDFYFTKNSKIYLTKDAKLTLSSRYTCQNNMEIYIAEGAELTINGTFETNGAKVYNNGKITSTSIINSYDSGFIFSTTKGIINTGYIQLSNNNCNIVNEGTINANQLQVTNTALFYNTGTLDITKNTDANGELSVENNNSVIVNDGTIKAKRFHTAGGGHIENNGDITISGNTDIDSNNNTWVNNGQYRTGNFIYTAGSNDVINNCMLTVDELFRINLGDTDTNGFKVDGGVVTKNFLLDGPSYIYMASQTVFKVTETATMHITKANYGIYGPENGGYAVFQANNVVAGGTNQGYEVTYGNNLYVAAESHFANGLSGSYPYIDIKGNAKVYAPGFEDGKPAITISATTCNPGFTGDSGSGSAVLPANPSKVRVIAEDLSTNYNNGKDRADFDYNDVVFDVQKSGNNLKITLKAAGGTLPLTIGGAEGETEKDLSEQYDVLKYEVHRLFKVSTGTMVNTNAPNGITRDDVVFEIPMPEGVSSSDNLYNIANSIPIRVLREGVWTTLPVATPVTESSLTAAKLAVDDTYNWCDERVNINNKFPYTDKNGVSRDPRFKLYLNGQLSGKWWLESNRLAGD